MEIDQYSQCPCGSGKKFKWCCLPIHEDMAKAFQQDEQGQHDMALKLMEEVAAAHPTNPEAWGRMALLLWNNEKPVEAEAALTKAFEVHPQYPFGHYLRGRFRMFEGEILGALLLFRKATELYDPDARQILSELYLNIFDCEMKLNRPVAAHAAGRLALKADPANQQLRDGLDQVFGDANPNLPPAARKTYAYKPTRKVNRDLWDQWVAKANTSRLSDVLRAFDELAKADPTDPNVWYDLGLTHAWVGNHGHALAAFDKYVRLETDEAEAASAWALVEVLRLGQGMEDDADYVEHSVHMALRDPMAFVNGLAQLEKELVVGGLRLDQENSVLFGVVLDAPAASLVGGQTPKAMAIRAYLALVGNVLRLWSIDKAALDSAARTMREKFVGNFAETQTTRGPAKLTDLLSAALNVPVAATLSQEEVKQIIKDRVADYLENIWSQRSLKSLDGRKPIEAASDPVLRKKLRGVVQLLEEAGSVQVKLDYDFARLRAKLNLNGAASAAASPIDVGSLDAVGLAGLKIDALSPDQLELAFQTALRAESATTAGRFARALVALPPRPDRPDRFAWFNHLIQLALVANDFQDAISHVDEGEKDDCERNEGRRRNDYELRRGQILVKQGDFDHAESAFQRLIDRAVSDANIRGRAVEAFLGAKQGKRALKFAEAGIAQARLENKRDSVEYFTELADAARRTA